MPEQDPHFFILLFSFLKWMLFLFFLRMAFLPILIMSDAILHASDQDRFPE